MIVVAAAVAALLTYTGQQWITQSSDTATPLLQARAVLDGNVTLAHWTLSFDSFWTVEVPFYVIGVALLGLDPRLLTVVPAVIAALVFVTGLALISDRRRDTAVFFGGVVLFVLLALPSPYLAGFLLRSGNHIGTALFCLLAFLCFRRGRAGWKWFVGVGLLAVAMQGDLLALFYGVIPLALASLAAGARLRRWRAVVPGLGGAVAAVALAAGVRAGLVWVGVFSDGRANPLASRADMLKNWLNALEWGGKLLGFGQTAWPWWLQALHLLGIALVLMALGLACRSLVAGVARRGRWVADDFERWRTDDLLLLGAGCSICVFVALTRGSLGGYGRYLVPGLIFSAILAGRLVAAWTSEHRLAPAGARTVLRPAPLIVVVLVLAAFPVGFALNLPGAAPVPQTDQVQDFLAAHHLHEGIGDYWDASIITAESRGKVLVRPVAAAYDPSGRLERYDRMSNSDWYEGTAFQFFVFNAVNPWAGDDAAAATKTFGKPRHTYRIGEFEVLTWRHPISVQP